MSSTESPAASPEIAEFLTAAREYVRTATPPLTLASLSSIVFGAGKQIERLENGCDLTTGRLRAAWARLRELQAGGPRTRNPRNRKGDSDGEHDEAEERTEEAGAPRQER